jgi:hypothetical protein
MDEVVGSIPIAPTSLLTARSNGTLQPFNARIRFEVTI